MTLSAESSKEKEEEPDKLAELFGAKETQRKASPSSFAVLTDPIAGYEAKGGNWNNVADIVRLGILASHKKHDRTKVQFSNMDTRFDGMLNKLHILQHKLDDSLEELSKAKAAAPMKRRSSGMDRQTSTGSNAKSLLDEVETLQEGQPVGSHEKSRATNPFGAAARKAVQMSRSAGPLARRAGLMGNRLDMPPDLNTAPETDSDSSSDRGGGLTEEEQQTLLKIVPMDRKLADAGLNLKVLKNKFASMETRLDEMLRVVDTLQVKVEDDLSADAIAGIVKSVHRRTPRKNPAHCCQGDSSRSGTIRRPAY